jgi:hypothetical protein
MHTVCASKGTPPTLSICAGYLKKCYAPSHSYDPSDIHMLTNHVPLQMDAKDA